MSLEVAIANKDNTVVAVAKKEPADIVTLYNNPNGNVTGWSTLFDNNGVFALSQDGSQQKLEATNPPGNSFGIVNYSAQTWQDCGYRLFVDGSVLKPWQVFWGIRVDAAGSWNSNGYFFTKLLAGSGSIAPTGTTNWGNITVQDGFELNYDDEVRVEVTGTGAATRVQIYVQGILRFDATNPSVVHDTGTIAHGFMSSFVGAATMNTLIGNQLVYEK